MTILQTTYQFGPDISLEYDKEQQLFIGRLISRGGVYEFQGPDRASVMYDIDHALRVEYNAFVRSIDHEKSQGKSKERSLGASGGNERYREIEHDKRSLTSAAVTTGLSSLIPQMAALGVAAEVVGSLWGAATGKQKLFVAMFAGVKITAGSKKSLKKKLMIQRHRRIRYIMDGVRARQKTEKRIDAKKQADKISRRLALKRKKATLHRPKSWKERVNPDGKQKDWRERTDAMRVRISDKRQLAVDLWGSGR